MIQTRHAIFETNSSSTHTMVIATQPNIVPCEVTFRCGDFGWEYETYHNTEAKASYLYTAALECGYNWLDFGRTVVEILFPYNVNVFVVEPEYQTSEWGTWLTSGHIDHGYEASDFVQAVLTPELLPKFLFSEDSFIFTSNDNDFYDDSCIDKVDYPHEIFHKGN